MSKLISYFPLLKTGVRGIVPEKMFEFSIAVEEFWYIFGERKQTFFSPNTNVQSIVPRKIFEFSITVGEFGSFSKNENKLSSPLKRGLEYFPRESF